MAQEVDVIEIAKPVVIVDHHGVRGAVAEFQKPIKNTANCGRIAGYILRRQQFAALVASRRIADQRRTTADEDDRFVAGFLKMSQKHDLQQAAHMQGRGRAIEADIGHKTLVPERRVEAFRVG